MSKINIREYDNTKAGITQYANFAVVVPGFLGNAQTGYDQNSVFDENGVYVCSSQSDFYNYIGWVQTGEQEAKAAVPCKLTLFTKGEQAYYTIPEGTKVYIKDTTKIPKPEGGYLDDKTNCYKYDFTSDGKGHFITEEYYYVNEAAGDKLGSDAVSQIVGHYGNKIAYELLGIGYTVVYKRMRKDPVGGTQFHEDIADLATANYWEALKDRSVYDFRYILTGLLEDNGAAAQIAALANNDNTKDYTETGRGDVIALLDVSESKYSATKTQKENILGIAQGANSLSGNKYCMNIAPYVTYNFSRSDAYKTVYGQSFKFPGSFHYLACAAKSNEAYAEWYAVAGYARGISNLPIASAAVKLGDAAINALQPRKATSIPVSNGDPVVLTKAVNLISKVGDQYLLWGNRTAHSLDNEDLVASHFLNIRQLCCTLKKQIYIACKQLTFDPNSDILWINFKNKIKPILEKMKNDQGIEDYVITKVTDSRKGLLSAQVRIIPIEAVEDFEIGIYLEDTLEGVIIEEN